MEFNDLGLEAYINENLPKEVDVPTGVSEAEAIKAVQQQFRDAGFDCPEAAARGLVQEACKQQQDHTSGDCLARRNR